MSDWAWVVTVIGGIIAFALSVAVIAGAVSARDRHKKFTFTGQEPVPWTIEFTGYSEVEVEKTMGEVRKKGFK